MSTKRSIYVLALILMLGISSLRAAVPLGFPGSQLDKGIWHVDAEYAQGEADWDAQGRATEVVVGVGSMAYTQNIRLDNLETHAVSGQVGYGLCEAWDVFLRAGTVQAQADIRIPSATPVTGNGMRLDSDYGWLLGLGTRATLYQNGPLSLGGVLQGTWFDPGASDFVYRYNRTPSEILETSARLRYLHIQLALAAVYQKENYAVWIGPFLERAQGDLDLKTRYTVNGGYAGGVTNGADLDEDARVGIHLGGSLQCQGITCRLTGQFTSDSWLLGLGGMVKTK